MAQLGDQVLRVLHAHRQADEAVADPEGLARRRREWGVRHDPGMLDEALHAAQTLRQREQAAALERTARALEAAAQYRGDDTAETTRHLSPGKRVLRVTRQPRVVHALDPGMLLQELRDGERIGAASLHGQR